MIIPKAQRWIIHKLFQYRLYLFLTTLGSILDIILFSLPPLFVAAIINELFGARRTSILIFIVILFLIVAVIQSSNFFMASYFNEILAHRITTDITADLFNTLQNRSLQYLDRIDLGEIMARATNDTRRLNIGLSPAYRITIDAVIQIFVVAAMLWYFDVRFIIFLIFFVPIYGFFALIYLRVVYKYEKQILSDFERVSVVANESFTGIRELKSFTAENRFKNMYNEASIIHATTNYRIRKNEALYLPHLVFWIFSALVAITGFYWIVNNTLTIVGFVGALGAFLVLRFLSAELAWTLIESATAIAASNRLYKILFEDKEKEISSGTKNFDLHNIRIEFDHVWFRYNDQSNYVLKDLSFTIEPNETVVLVGPPGSGKSTFNILIQRLYLQTKGVIRLCDITIEDINNESLRKNVSTIEQEIFLFSDTIESNIRFGIADATDDEVSIVAQIAQADKFIDLLPEKYKTLIGERGVRLSGGEKQRIAIARALLMSPAILLMDDASSALDAKTEMEIQKAISIILKSRTSLITTHRLSIIARADKVIVLNEGQIVAVGHHNQLIQSVPEYRRLFKHLYELPVITTTNIYEKELAK